MYHWMGFFALDKVNVRICGALSRLLLEMFCIMSKY